MPRIICHTDDQVLYFLYGASNLAPARVKRDVISALTLAVPMGLDIADTETRITSLAL